MNDTLDTFVQNLQDQIYEETREAFGEAAYQRWRNPLHMEAMTNPDGHAAVRGGCGDSIQIFLKFEHNRVRKASFQTDGCGSSLVCGSYAAEMAMGKTPDEVFEITGESILKKLGGLPEENEHCAFLAAETLRQAVNDYVKRDA